MLLGELLKASNYSPSHSFEFGARKRDFGLHPSSGYDVGRWFAHTIDMIRQVAVSGSIDIERIRHLVATHFRELLRVGMLDELATLAEAFAIPGGWPEGWVAVRGALRRSKDDKSSESYKKLQTLSESLRPQDLPSRLRAYALTKDYGPLDIVELDEEVETNHGARLKIEQYCVELGMELAKDGSLLKMMLPEIILSEAQRAAAIGRGLAEACESLDELWGVLSEAFLAVPEKRRNGQIVAGFLSGSLARSIEKGEELLDRVLAEEGMHPFYVWWQAICGINARAYQRLMTAAVLESVPIQSFLVLATGRSHEGLNDQEFDGLMRTIHDAEDGDGVVAEIIGMRFYGRVSDKLEVGEALKSTGRWFLSKSAALRNSRANHLVATVIRSCYDSPKYEQEARAFCSKVATALKSWEVTGWDMGEVMSALAAGCPVPFLDVLVEGLLGEDGDSDSPFEEIRGIQACPLDPIPEAVWIGWAMQKPETRFRLLARVVRFSVGGVQGGEGTVSWSPTAAALIEASPKPIEVLNTLLERFWPNSWTGSRAGVVDSRIQLLESLNGHKNTAIAAWAAEKAAMLAVQVAKEREQEARRSRERDERFE
jgi:hypothetical protein